MSYGLAWTGLVQLRSQAQSNSQNNEGRVQPLELSSLDRIFWPHPVLLYCSNTKRLEGKVWVWRFYANKQSLTGFSSHWPERRRKKEERQTLEFYCTFMTSVRTLLLHPWKGSRLQLTINTEEKLIINTKEKYELQEQIFPITSLLASY